MVVNGVMLPFAYIKTIVHKALLAKRFKSSNYCIDLFVFTLLGVPLLLCSQLTDMYYFFVHSYSPSRKIEQKKTLNDRISQADFESLYTQITQLIDEKGQSQMNARELVQS